MDKFIFVYVEGSQSQLSMESGSQAPSICKLSRKFEAFWNSILLVCQDQISQVAAIRSPLSLVWFSLVLFSSRILIAKNALYQAEFWLILCGMNSGCEILELL